MVAFDWSRSLGAMEQPERPNSDSSSSEEEDPELAALGQMEMVRSAAAVEVSWKGGGHDEDAEFLAAEKEAERQAAQDQQRDAQPSAPALQPAADRSAPDVVAQVDPVAATLAGTRIHLEQMRAALAGHVASVSESELNTRAENDALRTELAELSAVREEATELRAANVALQKAKADADAANVALTETNSELMESNAKLAAEQAQVWKEREFISPRDRELTFDATCRLMDKMRVDMAAKERQNKDLAAQVAELTAQLDAARVQPSTKQTATARASTTRNTTGESDSAGEHKVAVHGSADLRDEVMAVAERLVQRSQSMSQQEANSEALPVGGAPILNCSEVPEAFLDSHSRTRPEAAPRHGAGSFSTSLASRTGAFSSEVTEALGRSFSSYSEPLGSAHLTTSMVSPRTRTELAHAVMAEREATSRRLAAEEAAQRRDTEERWSTQRAVQEAAERKESEEKAQARKAKRREIEKQRTEQERLRIEEQIAERREESAAARRAMVEQRAADKKASQLSGTFFSAGALPAAATRARNSLAADAAALDRLGFAPDDEVVSLYTHDEDPSMLHYGDRGRVLGISQVAPDRIRCAFPNWPVVDVLPHQVALAASVFGANREARTAR